MMTPAEIAEIAAYAQSFNQRLGQFISNALSDFGWSNSPDNGLFYISDADLLEICRSYYKQFHAD